MNRQNFFKWLKRGTLVLAIIPILIFLAFAGAVSLIDFNQYKPQIEKEVTAVSGRDFKIEGAIEVSILPFMFNIGQMALRNKSGFTEENVLSIREVQVELSLQSLLIDKEISVISLELIEPKLHLIKTESGDNWSDIKFLAQWLPIQSLQGGLRLSRLTGTLQKDLNPQTASEWFASLQPMLVNHPKPKGLKADFHWAVESLVVRKGEIQFENQKAGHLAKLSEINILTFDVVKGQPFDVSSEFTFQHSPSQKIYDFRLNTTLEIADNFQKWILTDWSGVLKFRMPVEDKVPEVRLTTEGERFEIALDTQNITVIKGKLAGLDAELTSSFSGMFGLHSALQGTADIKNLNFKNWAYHLGLPMLEFVDKKALTEGNGAFEWQWDGEKILLKALEIQIDESQLQGMVSYQIGEEPVLAFDLSLDQLNLDAYQAEYRAPAKMTRPGQSNVNNSAQTGQDTPSQATVRYLPVGVPIEILRNLNASGQLKIGQLTAWNVSAQTIQVNLLAQQGMLSLAPLDAELYQGQLRSKLTLDMTNQTPEYHWKGRLNQMNLQAALAAHPDNLILEGVLTSRFDLQSKGSSDISLKKNLSGLFSSEITQVKIAGLDINQLLNGSFEAQATSTKLDRVYLSGQLQQGIYSAKQFIAKSERFSGSGAGTFDVNTAQVDSQFLLTIENPTRALRPLKGLEIPLSYQGRVDSSESEVSADKARWGVDMAKLMASPAYQTQQKMIIAQLSSLIQ